MTTRIVALMHVTHTPRAAVEETPSRELDPGASPPAIEVLFPEAKHLERRRRAIALAILLALGGLVTGLVAAFGTSPPRNNSVSTGSGSRATAVSAGHVARVATVELTHLDKYSAIAAVGNHILIYGSTGQSNITVANTCFSASVDPSSLVLSDERSGSCADPALQGREVLPTFDVDKGLISPSGGPTATVRVARVASGRRGYTLGPVVMTFPSSSGDSAPTWIYGGGDLWLYEWDNPGGFDLARISAATGEVLQRIEIPKIEHPVLAYDGDGLWIAPSGQSGSPQTLYLVTPGAAHATPVFHFPADGFAKWLVASGHDVWVNAQPVEVSRPGVVWMLAGARATPVWHVRENATIAQVFEILGDSGMVGNDSDGLWAAAPTSYADQQIVRISPMSGSLVVEASLKTGYTGSAKYLYLSPLTAWEGATLAGSFFLLDPPAPLPGTANGHGGFSALYRITPVA
jgi:hypothetical protein